jgi:hypothetical protein
MIRLFMKTFFLALLIFAPLLNLFARQHATRVRDPILEYFKSFVRDSVDLEPSRAVLKIEYDFNSDGIPDLALSNWPDQCGSGGCGWDIYLGQSSGGYVQLYDGLFFSDGAISVQPIRPGVSRIYIYVHNSAVDGLLENFELSARGIKHVWHIPDDTANWGKFLRLSNGAASPMVVYSCNVLQFFRTHQYAWKRFR